jgi:8-oxo-dGTP diphosphatase
MEFAYEYEKPVLAVDAVVFGFDYGDLKILLIKRGLEPFIGQWALPGGFVRKGESPDRAVRRELAEETGIAQEVFLEQLYTFGEPDRDPRGWVPTVAHFALVKLSDFTIKAATDAKDVQWFRVSDLPQLAFDHAKIISMALQRLKGKVRYQPVGFELLPPQFSLTELQHLYEALLEQKLDKRNFRKKILSLGILRETGKTAKTAHRPAALYEFDGQQYEALKSRGINFEL